MTSEKVGTVVLLAVGLGLAAFGLWTLLTSGNLILGWGLVALGAAFCLYALIVAFG